MGIVDIIEAINDFILNIIDNISDRITKGELLVVIIILIVVIIGIINWENLIYIWDCIRD